MKIYVASSWRNPFQPAVVKALREDGHEIYDFRNPGEGDDGFHWREIDGGWAQWSSERYVKALSDPIAEAGFKKDKDALDWCDVCVCVLPCGRSAHLELGYVIGQGKTSVILMPDPEVPKISTGPLYLPENLLLVEPELMNKLADRICLSLRELRYWLHRVNSESQGECWCDETATRNCPVHGI